MAKLASFVQRKKDTFALNRLVYDAYRFIMYHKVPIESFPLQTYVSALLFSPTRSLIRRLFTHEAPTWVTILPSIQDDWDACLQTLEGHSDEVQSVVFSHDSNLLISGSLCEVKIWDAVSGQCLQTLRPEIPEDIISVAFSYDSKQLAAVLSDGTVYIWNVIDDKCLLTLEWTASTRVQRTLRGSINFSLDSAQLVSTHHSKLAVWDLSKSKCPKILEGHSDNIISVSFSGDSKRLASASNNGSIKIWDVDSGKCIKTHELDRRFESVAFFRDLTWIISSALHNDEILIWDRNSGERLQTFNKAATSLALTHDSMQLASASYDSTVEIWDVNSGECLQTFRGHSAGIYSLSFSRDSTHLASASRDRTIKIWDLSQGQVSQRQGDDKSSSESITLSVDSTRLALLGRNVIEIWDVQNGKCLHTLEGR
ncbi:MAG: hypothetical protein M1820_008621 [Bogoriella megaspora]|nr:MAG: hypothetical protein M1820_008621 [Bogoriella megaspora]